jgi:hypothetical protein
VQSTVSREPVKRPKQHYVKLAARCIRHHRLELGPFRLTAGFMILELLNDGPIQGTAVFAKLY